MLTVLVLFAEEVIFLLREYVDLQFYYRRLAELQNNSKHG